MTDAEKLAALRIFDVIEVVELVKVSWPSPEGEVYYVGTVDPYLLRGLPISLALLELRLPGRSFQEILNDPNIADDKVTLKLWDGDERDAAGSLIRTGHISDLANTHGPGQRVEIYYWFPQVSLLLSEWWGHLQPVTRGGVEWYQVDAEAGFLSSMLPMPRRGLYNSCSALFGGWLKTQAEIDRGDCPYNRHLTAGAAPANFTPTNNANGTGGGSGSYSKTSGGSAWNCGASHSVAPASGDVSFEFVISAGFTTIGFTNTASPLNGNTDFVYGLQFNPAGDVTLRLDPAGFGASIPKVASWAGGNTFRVEVRGGRFRAWKGSTEIIPQNFSAPAPSYPLHLGIAIFTSGAGIASGQVVVGDIGGAPGFGNLDPATGLPYTDCARNRTACIARLGDDLSYLGFDTVIQSYTVNQTKGANITVTTRGNESNLKRPLRVVIGERDVADLDLLAYTVEPDTKHPEGGAVAVLFGECEGPILDQSNHQVNGVAIGAMHLNARNGDARQARTGFSPQVSNYSSTALFFGRAQGDFTKTSADQLRGSVHIKGLRNIRRYLSESSFVEEYSTDRAWALLRCLTDYRWGHGLDVERFLVEEDWVPLSFWGQQMVSFTDKDGTLFNGQRTQFNAELIDRSTQQQVSDICMAGRYTLPFRDAGKLRIRPLGRALELFSPRSLIEPAFLGAYDRAPTSIEFNAWDAALRTARNTSHAALLTQANTLVNGLLTSGEYAARGRTDEQFAGDCYFAFLNRAGDEPGIAFWTSVAVDSSGHRNDVLAGFDSSSEFQDRFTGAGIPYFTDRGSSRNVIFDNDRSTLVRTIDDDKVVPNRIIVNFDDSAHGNAQRPLVFEDPFAQLRAGRAFGDTTRRAVEKTYTALGVTDVGEAVRLGNLLLHLGPFDEGGTENNLRVEFTAWFSDCLALRKYDLIEVDSATLDRYGFNYFRVVSLRRMPDLKVQIVAQAYPEEYYENIESVFVPPPIIGTGGDINPGGDLRLPPGFLGIDEATHDTDRILIKLSRDLEA